MFDRIGYAISHKIIRILYMNILPPNKRLSICFLKALKDTINKFKSQDIDQLWYSNKAIIILKL